MSENQEVLQLFGECDIEGIIIKPWTLKQVVELTGVIGEVIDVLQKQGVSLDQQIDIEMLVKTIEMVAPRVPEILSVSLRKPIMEIEELPWGQAVALTVQVVTLNIDHLKKYGGYISGGVNLMMEAQKTIQTSPSQA